MNEVRLEAKGRDAITGKKCEIHIHHIKPVSKYPESACEKNNLIAISAEIHLHYVHNGDRKYLKGLSEEQVKAYEKLHVEAEGVRAPFSPIIKEKPVRLGITKKDIIADPHKYDNVQLTSGLRNLYLHLIYVENFKNTHGGLTPDEYNRLQVKCRRQYNIYKAKIVRENAPKGLVAGVFDKKEFENMNKVLSALSPYPLTLSAISEISGLEKSEVKRILNDLKETPNVVFIDYSDGMHYFTRKSYRLVQLHL